MAISYVLGKESFFIVRVIEYCRLNATRRDFSIEIRQRAIRTNLRIKKLRNSERDVVTRDIVSVYKKKKNFRPKHLRLKLFVAVI